MEIYFNSRKVAKVFNSRAQIERTYGRDRGKFLMRRLNELEAAECLADMRCLPQARCHELKGNRKGEVSVDILGPWRLTLQPADDPVPTKPDGGLDWAEVRAVIIIGVEDTHD